MDDLENILSGNDEQQPEVAVAPEPEVVAEAPVEEARPETVERPRGPDGKFISKGETPEAPAAESPAAQEPQLDHAALIGERRRRQEAEDRIRALEEQMKAPPAPPAPAPDQWEDPEGYANWVQSEAVSKAVEAARTEAYQAFQTQRIMQSAEEAKAKLPDYNEKMQVFEQMMASNPQLLQELYRAPNPAEYAYNTAKTQLEITQYGGLDGLIAARVQEALKAQATPVQPVPQPLIPDSLAGEQSARGSAVAYQPPSLDDLLK